jgi:hypothetical protein
MARRHVLVLVAAVVVLSCAGLLFPAISRTREAAARMTCAGHFCQTGYALHNYAAAHDEAFPAGTIPNPDLPPERRLSWWVSTLPYIEQGRVYEQFDLTLGQGDPRNAQPASKRFRHLVCPSSDEYYDHNAGGKWKSPTPLAHYVGVAGVGEDAATLPLGHPRSGVFGYDRRTKLKGDVPDGLSNTLLVIETSHNPGHWAYGGRPTVRSFEQDPLYIGPGRAFGGFHNGPPVLWGERTHNCVVAMADGSYRIFTNHTGPEVLEALATAGGKETLPADW